MFFYNRSKQGVLFPKYLENTPRNMRASLKLEVLAPTPSRTGQPAKIEGRKSMLKEEALGGDRVTYLKRGFSLQQFKNKGIKLPRPPKPATAWSQNPSETLQGL